MVQHRERLPAQKGLKEYNTAPHPTIILADECDLWGVTASAIVHCVHRLSQGAGVGVGDEVVPG